MAIGAIAKENETILFQNNTLIVLLLKISVSSFIRQCVEGLTHLTHEKKSYLKILCPSIV